MEIYETEVTAPVTAPASVGAIPLLSPNSDMEWWEYDLQLAAELGKALLERNQELEAQAAEAEAAAQELRAENQFLTQKLATLRSLNETRMKMYEQVDTNAQDLEEANRRLRSQSLSDKEAIAALTTSLEASEVRVEALEAQIKKLDESLKEKGTEKTETAEETVKQVRFNQDLTCKALQEETDRLLLQLTLAEKNRQLERQENDSFVCSLMEENKTLRLNLEALRSKMASQGAQTDDADDADSKERRSSNRRQTATKTVSFETAAPVDGAKALSCRECGAALEDACRRCLTMRIQEEAECDDVDEVIGVKDRVVVRLKHGGSAYGSRESLNKIAIVSPMEEPGNQIDSIHIDAASTVLRATTELGPESLMSELGTQYAVLIQKYETLLKQKEAEKSSSSPEDVTDAAQPRGLGNLVQDLDGAVSRSVQTEPSFLESSDADEDPSPGRDAARLEAAPPVLRSSNAKKRQCRSLIVTGLEQGRDPTDYGFDHSPPEYKELFKEIFATLRRTVDKESARPPTPPGGGGGGEGGEW